MRSACFLLVIGCATLRAQTGDAEKLAPYYPTPETIVDKMLRLGGLKAGEKMFDLGSGDGRIVIAAVMDYGAARAVGVEIDPVRILEANANAQQAGVSDRVQFIQGDVLETDVSEATVVTLFMSTAINLKLKPKLMAQLKPGSRVVSHAFDMGDWKPTEVRRIRDRPVYLWAIPPRR